MDTTKPGLIKIARRYVRRILNFFERILRHIRWNWREWQEKRTWHTPAEIAEYRKKIKVYDVFTFFNELDVLELRLNILDPYVDYFVLSEASQTFSGDPKPMHYALNKERFKKWNHKIIYCPITDIPRDEADIRERLKRTDISETERKTLESTLTTDNVGRDVSGKAITVWLKEYFLKEGPMIGLTRLSDDDICYISDLDEIWNPELVIDYSSDKIFKLRQIGYMYYLNNRSNEEDWVGWTGTVVTKYKNVKKTTLNHIRTHRKMDSNYVFLRNGGWHFAFQGGYEGAKRKLVDFNHPWYKPEDTLNKLDKRVAENKHYRGTDFKLWKDERGLPKYILDNKEKYRGMLR